MAHSEINSPQTKLEQVYGALVESYLRYGNAKRTFKGRVDVQLATSP